MEVEILFSNPERVEKRLQRTAGRVMAKMRQSFASDTEINSVT
jgi:hypothetical protein